MDFSDQMKATIETWMGENNDDEWLFADFRALAIDPLEPYRAFECLDEVANLISQYDLSGIWSEILEIILALARQSGTTERPRELQNKWEYIEKCSHHSNNYGKTKFEELCSYYRVVS